jgi:hypothetical protein
MTTITRAITAMLAGVKRDASVDASGVASGFVEPDGNSSVVDGEEGDVPGFWVADGEVEEEGESLCCGDPSLED